MINIRLVRGRIKSAKNISQITKAMELVAAAKMRKAQSQALAGKLYADKIYEMVMNLASKVNLISHPLLAKPQKITGKKLIILISTNKGLCGGLNTNLFRFLYQTIGDKDTHAYLTLGKKGALFVSHLTGSLHADFSNTVPFIQTIPALTELAIHEFTSGNVDSVELVYSEFISILKQQPKHKTILPLSITPSSEEVAAKKLKDTLIEPDATTVFNALLPHYLENQLRDAVLQADASEHSARMVAMRNATDNAKSFIRDLTLIYNKARQEKITTEISDMVVARLAVEG